MLLLRTTLLVKAILVGTHAREVGIRVSFLLTTREARLVDARLWGFVRLGPPRSFLGRRNRHATRRIHQRHGVAQRTHVG